MPPRYFFTTSASRPISLEGRTYKFEPMSILGGRISGLFEAKDETDQAILGRAVAQRIGISEISPEEAERAKKKRKDNPTASAASSANESKPPRVVAPPGPLFSVQESAPTAGSVATAKTEITLPRVISLVRTGPVNPPRPLVSDRDRILRQRLGK